MFIVIGTLIVLGIVGLVIDKQYKIDQEDYDWRQ
jgi:putative effector of murein hydrolase LrgA (UPF0299 family)